MSSHLQTGVSFPVLPLFVQSGRAGISFYTLGWCVRLCGLSPVCPGFPRALQCQGLLLVHHNIIYPLIGHTAARATALLLRGKEENKRKGVRTVCAANILETLPGHKNGITQPCCLSLSIHRFPLNVKYCNLKFQ